MLDNRRTYTTPRLDQYGRLTAITAATAVYKCTPGTDDLVGPNPGGDDPLYAEPQPGRNC